MTAFEILLNKFYETIEQNEPILNQSSNNFKSIELFSLIKRYIQTSFIHGNDLRYRAFLVDLTEKSGKVLQKANHDDWLKIKHVFVDNDLHKIRRDRNKVDLALLKRNLDEVF